MADCASVAGLAALAHFRRPDVTLQGDVIQVRLVLQSCLQIVYILCFFHTVLLPTFYHQGSIFKLFVLIELTSDHHTFCSLF